MHTIDQGLRASLLGAVILAATMSLPAFGGGHGPDGYPANGVYRIGERKRQQVAAIQRSQVHWTASL